MIAVAHGEQKFRSQHDANPSAHVEHKVELRPTLAGNGLAGIEEPCIACENRLNTLSCPKLHPKSCRIDSYSVRV